MDGFSRKVAKILVVSLIAFSFTCVSAVLAFADAEDSADSSGACYTVADDGSLVAVASVEQAVKAAASSSGTSKGTTFVVALDPGHGGSDSGAVGVDGLVEKTVNWKIAQYCKKELENYAGVSVYITRKEDENPGLEERVQRAQNAGANVFVSIHNNSASSTEANGAEVYYPDGANSYNPTTSSQGKLMADKIIAKLADLGLTNRGTKTRTSHNTSYPGSTYADYYGVIRHARLRNIPGIIVEHAFMSNAADNKKLRDESFLQKLGKADADGIASAYDLGKGDWEKQSNGKWKYRFYDGTYATNEWRSIGAWYYFNANGYAVTGWKKINDLWYLFGGGNDCSMKMGWKKSNNKWYYLDPETGAMATGARPINGKWYCFNGGDNGSMMSGGWKKVDGKWYYLSGPKDGSAKTGWYRLSGKWYYLSPDDGAMATGVRKIGSRFYCFGGPDDGAMKSGGWYKYDGKWYYLNDASDGSAKTGWKKIGGAWYYLDPSSAAMLTGWQQLGTWYYFGEDNDGAMKTGWQMIAGSWYYFGGASDGGMKTGWLKLGSTWYYLSPTGGMVTGQYEIKGKSQFFKDNGEWVGEGSPIMGTPLTTVAKMVEGYNKAGRTYPSEALKKGGAEDITKFCQLIYDEAVAEGVRPEVLWAQIMNETGFLQFGGDVSIEQFNFGGLGATGGGVAGASFSSVQQGIRAQVQHLKCYACTDPLKNECVDPRWSESLRGKSILVQWLGIPDNPYGTGWAAGKGYGFNLISEYMEPYLGVR